VEYRPSVSDELWAVGVTLYQLLVGHHPFGSDKAEGFSRRVVEETPVAPHVANPVVPPELSAVCMRLLEKEPKARYANAREAEQALEKVLAHAGIDWRLPLHPWRRPEEKPAPSPGSARAIKAVAAMEAKIARQALLAWALRVSRGKVAVALGAVLLACGAAGLLLASQPPNPPEPPAAARPAFEAPLCQSKGPPSGFEMPFPTPQAHFVQEMEGPSLQPHSVLSAEPTWWDSLSAPGAATVAPRKKEDMRVRNQAKTQQKKPLQQPAVEETILSSSKDCTLKWVCLAATCSLVATGPGCASAPEPIPTPPARRHVSATPPEPEPCPEEAAETMKKLRIYPERGHAANAKLVAFDGLKPTPLKEYDFMKLTQPMGDLKKGTQLKVRFYLTDDRAYGRITQAYPEGTDTPYIVCLEVLNDDETRGLEREPSAEPPGGVLVWPVGRVKAVRYFK
jgi:serine/threonine-protein kinase